MPRQPVNLVFINVDHPEDARQRSKDADIRSHVASQQWLSMKKKGTRASGLPVPASASSSTSASTSTSESASSSEEASSSESASSASSASSTAATALARRRRPVYRGFNKKRISVLPIEKKDDREKYNYESYGNGYDFDHDNKNDGENDPFDFSTLSFASSPIHRLVGGYRVDPFWTYPIAYKPFVPELVDHYIVTMAVDIPELDQPGNKGLIRTSWFPLVMSQSSLFLVIMLISASHRISVHGNDDENLRHHVLRLRYEAIRSINLALTAAVRTAWTRTRTKTIHGKEEEKEGPILNDALVGAIAKMASYEAMFGGLDSYSMHMRGLKKAIDLRGGLDSLGLNGLLRRMVVWIDRNAAFLHGWKRFFPWAGFVSDEGIEVLGAKALSEPEFEPEPNPGQFLGAS